MSAAIYFIGGMEIVLKKMLPRLVIALSGLVATTVNEFEEAILQTAQLQDNAPNQLQSTRESTS